MCSHGRDAGRPIPPIQTRTCGFPASGSSVVLTAACANIKPSGDGASTGRSENEEIDLASEELFEAPATESDPTKLLEQELGAELVDDTD